MALETNGNAIYSSGFQVYALFLTLSSVGVPNAVSKLVSEKISVGDERGAKRIFKIAFAVFAMIGFVSSFILFFNAHYIANNILQISETELTLQVLAPSIFFVSVISVFRGYFNARKNMRPTANSQSMEQFVKTIFAIIIVEYICMFVSVKEKTEVMAAGAAIATTIAALISLVYLFIYYRKDKYVRNRYFTIKQDRIFSIIRNIIIVSAPITISAILGTVNKNIDSITVVRGLKNFMSVEDAKIQYGILSGKVETLVVLPMSFNIAITTSLIPAVAAAKARNCLKDVENKIEFSILITIIIGLASSMGMIVFAEDILKLLFPNASSGAFIYQISSVSIIFVLLNQTVIAVLQGIGKQFVPVISLFIGMIVKLAINLTFVRINPESFIFGGTAGAAFGTVVCYSISMIINYVVLIRNIDLKIDKMSFIVKPVFCTILMCVGSRYIFISLEKIMQARFVTIISIMCAVIIYVLSIILTKTLKFSELNRKYRMKSG